MRITRASQAFGVGLVTVDYHHKLLFRWGIRLIPSFAAKVKRVIANPVRVVSLSGVIDQVNEAKPDP